jgi:hypothetical protein
MWEGFPVKKLLTFIFIAILGFTLSTSTSMAQPPTKKYTSCKAVWKKYPTGLVGSNYFAERAIAKGYSRPRVNALDFYLNQKLVKDYLICPVVAPDVVPSAPQISSTLVSPFGFIITAYWGVPVGAGMNVVYDVYLNGTKVDEGLTQASYSWRNLAPSTAYTIGVVARNPAGSSTIGTATATTVSQEQASNPGRVKVTYSASGLVNVTLQSTSGTQQFSEVTNPTYEFWFTPGAFVYFSVQNQSDSGEVSCSIISNGRMVSSNKSSGAYVIASCSGRS